MASFRERILIRPYGERGWVLADLSEAERASCLAALAWSPPNRLLEYVPGYDSILLIFQDSSGRDAVDPWLETLRPVRAGRATQRLHRIPVVYDGPDLAAVAAEAGISEGEVLRRHAAPEYAVRMSGFSPGFPYLDGLDPALQVPRRATPRTRIEAGSVAIGGPHAGIYTVASPGGWHVLGRTNFECFRRESAAGSTPDPRAVFPLALADRVRFEPVEALPDG